MLRPSPPLPSSYLPPAAFEVRCPSCRPSAAVVARPPPMKEKRGQRGARFGSPYPKEASSK